MGVKEIMLDIWSDSSMLQKKLDRLDKLSPVSKDQSDAIHAAQNGLRGWRGCNLGEMMNRFDLPPGERQCELK